MSRSEATEIRSLPLEVREARDGRTLSVRLATYGTPYELPRFTEVLRPGVFQKSIAQAARSLPLFSTHDYEKVPVGKAVAWRDTPETLEADFLMDTRAEAREMVRLIREDLMGGISVGFVPITDAWDTTLDKPRVERIEARLFESSLTPIPAYADAGVLALRSAGCPDMPGLEIMPTPRLLEARAWLAKIRTTN
jgi:HK97 family phage prohead protease